jgi:hypothetical protein
MLQSSYVASLPVKPFKKKLTFLDDHHDRVPFIHDPWLTMAYRGSRRAQSAGVLQYLAARAHAWASVARQLLTSRWKHGETWVKTGGFYGKKHGIYIAG